MSTAIKCSLSSPGTTSESSLRRDCQRSQMQILAKPSNICHFTTGSLTSKRVTSIQAIKCYSNCTTCVSSRIFSTSNSLLISCHPRASALLDLSSVCSVGSPSGKITKKEMIFPRTSTQTTRTSTTRCMPTSQMQLIVRPETSLP